MSKIIAFANSKGGTGKTTTAITVSSAMWLNGLKVVLIDADVNQGSISHWHDLQTEDSKLKDMPFFTLDDVSQLEKVKHLDADYIIFDCAGHSGHDYTDKIIEMADMTIIPVRTSVLDILASTSTYQEALSKGNKCCYMLTQVVNAKTVLEAVKDGLKEQGLDCLDNFTGNYSDYFKTFSGGETPYSDNRYSVPSIQVKKVMDEIIRRVEE